MASLQASPENKRDDAYFREKIGKIDSADALVNDRRLLRITLTAFGLEADLNSKAFIRKLLADGTTSPTALANRLADKRYRLLAETFGLGKDQQPQTNNDGFSDMILSSYRSRNFEAAVGTQDEALRLALNAEHELSALAQSASSEDTKWFTIMGNKPLRAVLETAFGLPRSFGQLDIDQQLKTFKSRAQSQFGDSSVSQFAQDAAMQKLIRIYLSRDQIAKGNAGYSPAQAALQLLLR